MSESLYALRQRLHISHSGLFDYINCSLKYRFARVDKLIPESKSSALVLGSAVHKFLEKYYRASQEGKDVQETELFHCVEDYIRRACSVGPEVHYKKGEDLNSVLMLGRDLVRCFLGEVPKEESLVLGVEVPFSIKLPRVDVPVIGGIDLMLEDDDGTITVVDHKTSQKTPNEKDVNFSNQMTLYHMAVKDHGYGDREILIRIDVLVKTKVKQFKQLYSSRTEEDEQRLIRKFQEAWKGIQAGIFLPNDSSWMCPNCEYQTACKNWAAAEAA